MILLSNANKVLAKIRLWGEICRQRKQLSKMDDYLLRDIGLSRVDADREANRKFWDFGTIRLLFPDEVLTLLLTLLFRGRLLYFKLLVLTELFFLMLAVFDLCGLYLNLSLFDLYLSILLGGLYLFLESKADPL